MAFLHSVFGISVFLAIAWLAGERRAVPWRLLLVGVSLQWLLALLLLKAPGAQQLFLGLNAAVLALEHATRVGTAMVFGYLGGGALPFTVTNPEATYVLAFRGLPLVLVISALSALLIHWGILQRLVAGFAWMLRRSLNVGGAEGVGLAANVFVGMVEAPLLVRPWLASLSRAELFSLMCCGLATVAGTVMVLYATLLAPVVDDALTHILTASVISVPAAVVLARVMIPPTDVAVAAPVAIVVESRSALDAVGQGTLRGLHLLLNIIAMLVVFVALIHLLNAALQLLPEVGGQAISLQRLLGWLMAPVVWLFGVPWSEAVTAGGLMGTKTVFNELLAYLALAQLPPDALSEHSRQLMTYALCGFANPGSLGILIGGLGGMAPERRAEIAALASRALLAGTLATCMTAAVVNPLL